MSFDEFLNIDTPENVVFGYEVVGIGSRFMAALVDTLLIVLLQLVCLGGITFLLLILGVVFDENSWLVALFILLSFILLWGYYIFFEVMWNGQSPGKRWVDIRVIRRDGLPVTAAEVIVRNLVRLIDFIPAFYGVGVVTMFIDNQSRRLGDMAAGTIVVREQEAVTLDSLALGTLRQLPTFKIYDPMLMTELNSWPVERLEGSDIERLETFLSRYGELVNGDRLAQQLLKTVLVKLEMSDRYVSAVDAPAIVSYVVRLYRGEIERPATSGDDLV